MKIKLWFCMFELVGYKLHAALLATSILDESNVLLMHVYNKIESKIMEMHNMDELCS